MDKQQSPRTAASNVTLNFFIRRDLEQRLMAESQRLALSKSEIARRALKIGLDRLKDVNIPG